MKRFEHTVVRSLGVRPEVAFAWLTDYREDDAQWVFDDSRARRSFQRRDARSLLVSTVARFAGVRATMDYLVRLAPPRAWRAHGQVRCFGLRVFGLDAHWEVEEHSSEGSILTARFRLHPLNFLAKVALRLWGSRIRRAFEESYDRIAQAVTAAAPAQLSEAGPN